MKSVAFNIAAVLLALGIFVGIPYAAFASKPNNTVILTQDIISFTKPYSRLPTTVVGTYDTVKECKFALHHAALGIIATNGWEYTWNTVISSSPKYPASTLVEHSLDNFTINLLCIETW